MNIVGSEGFSPCRCRGSGSTGAGVSTTNSVHLLIMDLPLLRTPVPNRFPATQLGQVAPIHLVRPHILDQEVHYANLLSLPSRGAIALDTPDATFGRVERAVMAVFAQRGQRIGNTDGGASPQQVSRLKGCRNSGAEFSPGQASVLNHQVEGHERLVLEGVSRSMGLHEPFAYQSLSVFQHRQKAVLALEDPVREVVVLLPR